jgi:hypothetical protein
VSPPPLGHDGDGFRHEGSGAALFVALSGISLLAGITSATATIAAALVIFGWIGSGVREAVLRARAWDDAQAIAAAVG